MPGLALGPGPLLACVAFLVSFGDREANKKLDCFRIAKRSLVWNRLGLVSKSAKEQIENRKDCTLTIQPSTGGRMHR